MMKSSFMGNSTFILQRITESLLQTSVQKLIFPSRPAIFESPKRRQMKWWCRRNRHQVSPRQSPVRHIRRRMKCRPRRNRQLKSPRHSPIRQSGENFFVAVAHFGRHSVCKIVASPNRATFHLSPSPTSAAIQEVKLSPRRTRRHFSCRRRRFRPPFTL